MIRQIRHLRELARPGKLRAAFRLLRDEPEVLWQNYLQRARPEQHAGRLLDVQLAEPLNIVDDRALDDRPTLNLLLPSLSGRSTGGPNTAINIACRAAAAGMPVRIIATERPLPDDVAAIRGHFDAITGRPSDPRRVALLSGADRAEPLRVGRSDLFMATHWTTAPLAQAALSRTDRKEFIYLIQDYEPGFYPLSSNYALALSTYELDFRAIFNQRTLMDHFVEQRIGRLGDPEFAARCISFEPAFDAALFRRPERPAGGRRRLLFYARPTNPRNLIGLGYHALRRATADPAWDTERWDFCAIGTDIPELPLIGDRRLVNIPWKSYRDYAELIRSADILVGLMLSPHTSYPVLEMAACGGIAITNTFSCKTAERLRAIADNIVAVPPTLEAISNAIVAAARDVHRRPASPRRPGLPASWDESLAPVDRWISNF